MMVGESALVDSLRRARAPCSLDGGTVLLGRRCAQQRRYEDLTRRRRKAVLCRSFHDSEMWEVGMLQRNCWSNRRLVHAHLGLGHGKELKVLPGVTW